MKRIYVAGAIDAPNISQGLTNIAQGIRAAVVLMLNGFAPFCPHLDFIYRFLLRDDERFPEGAFYELGLAWVSVCDAVYVLPNGKDSKGVKLEVDRAVELKIPVYYNLEGMMGILKEMERHERSEKSS